MTGRRDPFEADTDHALDALRMAWGDTYDTGFADGAFWAARLDGTGDLLRGRTPDELAAAIQANSGARSAR